ncbi:glycerate kinase [Thermosipho affectus]|uniref:Glycerate kinase n=1 Tax=Thermosipho affectus TaxID=660294 RepID=A0ABX3IIQ5_9BACT|nr:glycerate kinase [Thermosipho affectus]ONN27695.1 glycerate kinase [Thermosipho affectus]
MKDIAKKIILETFDQISPEKLVLEKLKKMNLKKVYVLSIGKAAWRMAKAVSEYLDVAYGIIITKYGYSFGGIKNFDIFEAGHPIPDENSLKYTKFAIEKLRKLTQDDVLLFLISGGGSSLFEYLEEGVTLEDLRNITNDLLRKGANIEEINIIRKKLSKVKGGKFLSLINAKVVPLVLSDVLGDKLEYIASGPVYPDNSTFKDVKKIVERYKINLNENIWNVLQKCAKVQRKISHYIVGNVDYACKKLEESAKKYGFNTYILTTQLTCQAREAGKFLASIVKSKNSFKKPYCLIFGGETVVKVKGNGLGGRNQELSFSAAIEIEGMDNVVIVSVGTDGTDGPTDAAGGIVDGNTVKIIREKGFLPEDFLENNDTYNALKIAGDLFISGPTGTNLNDIGFILKR